MKALIQRILTDDSVRDSDMDVHMAAAMSEKFYPWGSRAEM